MFKKIKSWFSKKKPTLDENPEYLIETIFNPETGKLVIIELVCSCGWPVAEFAHDKIEYWCEHCDRNCPDGLPTCPLCVELYMTRVEEIPPDDSED